MNKINKSEVEEISLQLLSVIALVNSVHIDIIIRAISVHYFKLARFTPGDVHRWGYGNTCMCV